MVPPRRLVYIFIRPVPATRVFLPLQRKMHKRFYVCHSGVLVTDLNIRELLLHNNLPEDGALGSLWEIYRTERDTNSVRELLTFTLSEGRGDWGTFSSHCVGTTTATNANICCQG
jgi:hypothetical protein